MRGARAFLVDSLADVAPAMLDGVRALGVTASASSPEWLVEQIIGAFANNGASVELLSVAKERVHFPLPMPPLARQTSKPDGELRAALWRRRDKGQLPRRRPDEAGRRLYRD